jgi:hypothetical protein
MRRELRQGEEGRGRERKGEEERGREEGDDKVY